VILDPIFETMPKAQLTKLQVARLQNLARLLDQRSPFYRQKFLKIGFEPRDLLRLADLRLLPFTEKEDLRDHYPLGLSTVPPNQFLRFQASSGVTGQMTVIGYTKRDLYIWAQLMARSLATAGVGPDDVVNVAFGYGLFTGGLGCHYGAEALGAAVLPCSSGASQRQITLMRDLKATVLCCTPSFALYLAELAKSMGLDFRDKSVFALKTGIFGAEPWSEDLRQKIESTMGITALDIYGLSEIMGPGVAMECMERRGLHIYEDHFFAEIIDPVTLKTVRPGQLGELVLTTLTKEGVPLLRYRTHDITSFQTEPCSCGRTFRQVTRFMGRSDDMVIIRGVNLYPSQVETLILSIEGLTANYQLVLDRVDNLDALDIVVELSPERVSSESEELAKALARLTKIHLGVNAKVTLVEPMTLPRSQGKAQRLVDNRAGKM
jgi:phenylacetate-CoA ligase